MDNFDQVDLSLTDTPVAPIRKKRRWWIGVVVVLAFLAAGAGGAFFYIQDQLRPISGDSSDSKVVLIKDGWSITQIAQELFDQKLIKNSLVFRLYGKYRGQAGQLQAGSYLLKPSMSVQNIYTDLVSGKTKQMTITFYPGTALKWRRNDRDKTLSVAEVLENAGYSSTEVQTALGAAYQTSLSRLLPDVKSLEGLLGADTFYFGLGAPIDTVIKHALEHTAKLIKENDLVNLYQKQGLDLYQGIALASIIEQEVLSKTDRAQAAQVFFSRLDQNMPLGSDVTYQYASRMAGTPNDLNIDSPYNTRRYPGLPPTPIALPSLSSLLAVAQPAQGDYLYFVSGDDGKNHFAKTYAEHQSNVAKYCQKACAVW